jgi:hypothetical protein
MKKPNVNYASIIGSSQGFIDLDFDYRSDAVYWPDYPYNSQSAAYNKSYTWDRARNRIPGASLFGTEIKP